MGATAGRADAASRDGAAGGRRRWLFRFALLLGSVAAAAAAGRAVIRFADRAGWLAPLGIPFDRPPHWKPVRGSDGAPLLDAGGEPLFAVVPDAARESQEQRRGGRYAAAKRKLSGTFRILSIGESTTYGAGYPVGVNYSRLLEERLRAGFGRDVEVVNCGRNGYDSHDWGSLAEELPAFAPDLLVIYAGHNELKLPNLLGVLDPDVAAASRDRVKLRLLGVPDRPFVAPPSLQRGPLLRTEQRRRAGDLFEAGLEALLETARRESIAVVLCRPASNILDHRPRCTTLLDPQADDAALAQVAATGREWDDGELPDLASAGASVEVITAARATLAAVEALLLREPEAALLHWRRGRLLLALGERERAVAAFAASQRCDALPERASPDLLARLDALATRFGAAVVDVEQRFACESARGVAGDDLFYDYCHPRLRGHWLIADLLLESIVASGQIAPPSAFDRSKEPGGATANDAARFAAWCERLGWSETMSAALLLAQARGVATELGTRPEVPSAADRRNVRELLDAARRMDAAISSDPFFAMVELLLAAGEGDAAGARQLIAAARARDAAEFARIAALVRNLPGWVAALAQVGLTITVDGAFDGALDGAGDGKGGG